MANKGFDTPAPPTPKAETDNIPEETAASVAVVIANSNKETRATNTKNPPPTNTANGTTVVK
jgi:hypothetical protein